MSDDLNQVIFGPFDFTADEFIPEIIEIQFIITDGVRFEIFYVNLNILSSGTQGQEYDEIWWE